MADEPIPRLDPWQCCFVVDDVPAAVEDCQRRFGWGPFQQFSAPVEEASYRGWTGPKLTDVALGTAGSVQVEIQNPDGSPVAGYSLAESHELYGDSLNMIAAWKDMNTDVGTLAGQPVRLRFVVRDADLFSYQFDQR